MSFFGFFGGRDKGEVECEHEITDVEIGGRGVKDRNDVEFGFTCPKCGKRLTGYAELGWDE
jgi:transcriptional regulator NrdR family protein